ncbi:C6 finger domain transcription factor tcpZ [Triangularia setosa]|uniref:C6 finger domain transcription factor tcpZ n=1 Tax=Triangularia setosa TaxID=2587417 RepID=A0AAN6W894_9PEZI|nr:C6 finger domain transcription factor tcpZ [Podospora setosa]
MLAGQDSSSCSRQANLASGSSEATKKLRSACDACHRAKVRCTGGPGSTCSRCAKENTTCHYSYRAHLGKPKGSLNKKTIERLKAMNQTLNGSDSRSVAENELFHFPFESLASPQAEIIVPPVSPAADFTLDTDLDAFTSSHILGGILTPQRTSTSASTSSNPDIQNNNYDEFHAGETRSIGDVSCPTPRPVFDPVSAAAGSESCTCVQLLTGQVSCLHFVSRNRAAAALDDVMRCTQQTASCVANFMQCHACAVDTQGFLLAGMVLSLMLDLILPLANSATRKPSPQVQIRVGNFDVSGQLGEMLEKVVLSSQLGALRRLAEKLDEKVEYLSCDTARKDFLKHEGNRLKRAFQNIADQAGVQDS